MLSDEKRGRARAQSITSIYADHPLDCDCRTWSESTPTRRHLIPEPNLCPSPDHGWHRCGACMGEGLSLDPETQKPVSYPLGELCPTCGGIGWVEVRWHCAGPAPGGPLRFGVPRDRS